MRNVMLLASSLHIGGAERVIATLAAHLDRSRFNVVVGHLKERGSIGEEIARAGCEVVAIPTPSRGLRRYLSFRALSRVLRERQIDLLHSHTTYSMTDGSLCRLARLGRTKLVHTFHFGNYPHYPKHYQWMERCASRVADHLIAVGQEQMGVIQSLYGIAADRITPIVNGTDAPEPAPDPDWAARLARDGRVVVGTTATLIEQKGLYYLLDVAGVCRREGVPVVFVVAGDGWLRADLEARTRALGLDDTVFFAGWKDQAHATMLPLYDVFFQPSLWEAMSVVVIEAMAASRPVVVTDVGDNRHVVRDGLTGFVVPPRDVPAMVDRLKRLVASVPLRRELGAAGRRRYEERYTAAVMARSHEQLYTAILEGRSFSPATLPRQSAVGSEQ